jgi:enoyl-CoA hydratase
MSDSVFAEVNGVIATVTLNAPERLNALNKDSWLRLGDVIETLSANDELRCIVLRGAGDKAFAAGADIKEFETERANAAQAKIYGELVAKTMSGIAACRHPTVAMIKGACIGGGLEIAACCDIRICGQSSRFGIPVKRLGLVMAHAELEMLLALVGRSRALEIILEGDIFGADKANAMGLVNRIVEDDDVESEAYATAERIAEGAPLAARWHKKFALRLMEPKPLTDEERDEGYACFDTADFKTGVAAFMAKQKPKFGGK